MLVVSGALTQLRERDPDREQKKKKWRDVQWGKLLENGFRGFPITREGGRGP